MWKGQLSILISYSLAGARVHTCTPKQALPLPFQYKLTND